MKDTTAVEIAKPWLLTGGSFLLANVSQVLGIAAMLFSISYTAWKWYRDIKKDGL
jgi:4-hydroxybenzoate polyprenyltransferase